MNITKTGIILLFIAIILIFIGSFTEKSSNVKSSGGIFIGPFPIFGFGNEKIFYALWILAIIIFVIFYLFLRRI